MFVYPRLNLDISGSVDRFGTMHLVATNIILWIRQGAIFLFFIGIETRDVVCRTLIKESLHEIAETEEEAHKEEEKLELEGKVEGFPHVSLEKLLPKKPYGNLLFLYFNLGWRHAPARQLQLLNPTHSRLRKGAGTYCFEIKL